MTDRPHSMPWTVRLLSVLIACCLGLLLAQVAQAATINVSTTAQLEAAVAAGTPGDVIVLAQPATSAYTPSATLNITRNLEIVGPTTGAGVRISGGNVTLTDPPNLIQVAEGVTATIRNVSIVQALTAGTAVEVSGVLNVDHANISGNTGLNVSVTGTGTFNAVNTVISDNNADGIDVAPGGTANLTNVTVAANGAGGINSTGGTVNIVNTLLSNAAGDCIGDAVTSSVASIERVGGTCGANIKATVNTGILTGNGGPTNSRALPAGSAAADAGSAASCPVDDQRYAPRAAGPCDIGSYERDRTNPLVSVPANITAPATSAAGAAVTYTATFSEPDGFLTNIPAGATGCAPASGSTFVIGTTTVTCNARNVDGLTASSTFTVTVTPIGPSDTTPPVITVPPAITAEATSSAGAAVTYTVTATDDQPGAVTLVCTPASGSTFGLGATTVGCSATDVAGNNATASFTVTVVDTTPPAVTVPANITVPATGASGAVVTFAASAADAVDGAIAAVCTPASGTTFAVATTTVNCSATDARNNTGTAAFTVTVTDQPDTTPPVITVPPAISAEATSPAGAAVNYTVTATDDRPGAVTLVCTPASGSTFGLGATTVGCSATDVAGNNATASFTVTVVDTTPPAVTVPANITVQATGPSGAVVDFTATAVDAVGGALVSTCTPASGATFVVGSTTVSCSATDAAGNTGTASFTVTVTPQGGGDAVPPVVTVPANITVPATGAAGAVVTFTATANDDVDGPIIPTCTPASGSTFVIGTTTVSCSATDAAGNTGTASFTVTVTPELDATPPVITVPPAITVEATSPAGAVVSYTVTATDDRPGVVTLVCTPASGSTFGLGATTVSCTANDVAGNSASASFTVTVQDTTAPTVTVPANITVQSTAPVAVNFTATASDAVTAPLTATCSPASGTTFALGTTTVTCSATDAAGNTGTASFTVTVTADQPVDARARIIALRQEVLDSALRPQVRRDLVRDLNRVLTAVEADRPVRACGRLQEVIEDIRWIKRHAPRVGVSAEQAASWLDQAMGIRGALGCSPRGWHSDRGHEGGEDA